MRTIDFELIANIDWLMNIEPWAAYFGFLF